MLVLKYTDPYVVMKLSAMKDPLSMLKYLPISVPFNPTSWVCTNHVPAICTDSWLITPTIWNLQVDPAGMSFKFECEMLKHTCVPVQPG